MRQIKIAIIAIRHGDSYVMHLRGGNDKERGALGLTGFFGGMIDEGETGLHAARRELSEETNLDLPNDELKKLGDVIVMSDFELEEVEVLAEVFQVEVPVEKEVQLNLDHEEKDVIDDTVVVVDQQEIKKLVDSNKITPATKAALEELIWC